VYGKHLFNVHFLSCSWIELRAEASAPRICVNSHGALTNTTIEVVTMAKSKVARRAAIYARVSTDGQTPENQLHELRAVAERMGWTVTTEFVDHGISGSKGRDQRPQFNAMCTAAVRREFDVIMSWSVDRLGRSLQHLITFLGEIHAKGVDLYLHQQGIDTTTPAGKAMFQMCGVFAEFERAMIQERVRAGLKRAKAAGKVLGRPSVPASKEIAIRKAKRAGKGIRAIARDVGCGVSVVQRVVAAM
jgi:DNA invertase Pin-like site-specific DNA recombinase